jgi:hypothetical protein
MVKVEIDLPQRIHDFLKAVAQFSDIDIMAYCVESIIMGIEADLDALNIDNRLLDPAKIKARHLLEEEAD